MLVLKFTVIGYKKTNSQITNNVCLYKTPFNDIVQFYQKTELNYLNAWHGVKFEHFRIYTGFPNKFSRTI